MGFLFMMRLNIRFRFCRSTKTSLYLMHLIVPNFQCDKSFQKKWNRTSWFLVRNVPVCLEQWVEYYSLVWSYRAWEWEPPNMLCLIYWTIIFPVHRHGNTLVNMLKQAVCNVRMRRTSVFTKLLGGLGRFCQSLKYSFYFTT